MALITALNIYPVKSCRGISVASVLMAPTGFQHDREWMIVREDGRFVTQREHPVLALIVPSLEPGFLVLRAPKGSELRIPLRHEGALTRVVVWRDTCLAFDAGDEAAQWLRHNLGHRLRLVRFNPDHRRLSSLDWTGGVEAPNYFTDGYPVLVISEASLADLNGRLEKSLPMNRFRPNLVVSGIDAYAEDIAHEFSTELVRLRAVKPCTRCIITTTDQASGSVDGHEPIRTLKTYRLSRNPPGVLFGQNLIVIDGTGQQLRVGETLDVSWKSTTLSNA